MAGFDIKRVSGYDRGILGGGLAALVASFLPYVGVDLGMLGSVSVNAWHGVAALGLLSVFAAGGLVAVRVFGTVTVPPFLSTHGPRITAVLAGLGTVLVILRAVTVDSPASVQWGGYLLFLAAIGQTVCAALALRESGATKDPAARASRL